MLPKYHFLLGGIVSLILYFGFDAGVFGAMVFLVATVGIDVDHYLYYVYRKRDWSLRRAVGWFRKNRSALRKIDKKIMREFYHGFAFLHGIEILFLVVLFGYFIWDIFYIAALGILFHLILDHIDQAIFNERFDKFSIVYDYYKYGDLKFVEEFEGLEKMVEEKLK